MLTSLIGLYGQGKFYAQTDAQEMLEDSYVTVSFVLENVKARNFKAPSFKNFSILQGPSQSNRTSIVNGKRSSLKSYTYVLQPKRTGNLKIASAQAVINGKVQKTKPISIRVRKVTAQSKGEKKFFVESILSDSTVSLGQQLQIEYVFYKRVDQKINSINIQSEDDFEGFYISSLKDFDQTVKRKIIDGTEYTYQTVRKLALFPQKVGKFDIDPTNFVVYIGNSNSNRRGFGSIFGSFKEEYTKTKNKSIKVFPLPKADPDFIGAVGNYSLSASSDKKTITTDQSISLILTIYGDGDPELLNAPALNFDSALEVYDPNFVKEDKYVDQGIQKHKTIYEYLIVPKTPGNYSIQPSINYYNPDSNSFLKATSSRLSLRVIKGKGGNSKEIDATLSERADKMYPYMDKINVSKKQNVFFKSIPFWLCLILVLSSFPILGYLKYKQNQFDAIDPELLKSQNAQKVAIEKLTLAKTCMDKMDQRSFYNEISNSILGYASDKIKIPTSELSKQNIANQLKALKINSTKIDALVQILSSCEMALFGGSNESNKMKETYDTTIEVISSIENDLL